MISISCREMIDVYHSGTGELIDALIGQHSEFVFLFDNRLNLVQY